MSHDVCYEPFKYESSFTRPVLDQEAQRHSKSVYVEPVKGPCCRCQEPTDLDPDKGTHHIVNKNDKDLYLCDKCQESLEVWLGL